MKRKIITFIKTILRFLPIQNVILFESTPDYSDNTKKVFDEMIERGWNKKFKMIWVCDSEPLSEKLKVQFKNIKNVEFLCWNNNKYRLMYRYTAKALICCNTFLEKLKDKQYFCFLAHGCALKNAVGYSLPADGDNVDVMTISDYMAKYDAHNLSCDVNYMKPLGYARNDELFESVDLKRVFSDYTFEKMIYWLPTYRQHRFGTTFHSDISMPILYTEAEAQKLNACAKENNTLVVVKVHPAQDLSKIEEFNLSNVLFINNKFFNDKEYTNYQLLGNSDAMISDYSSVYYDYLLCDKPIGLCFDDFEEYNKREGFTMDPNVILKGGQKIYNIDDLCSFVRSVANEEDKLSSERNEIKNLVHAHQDNQSTKRIVDYLEEKIR